MNESLHKDISETIDESKRWVSLLTEYSKLELIDKGSSLLSAVVIILLVVIIVAIALFSLCMALYHVLLGVTGSAVMSFLIITGVLIVLCLMLFLFKSRLIINPIVRMMSHLILKEED